MPFQNSKFLVTWGTIVVSSLAIFAIVTDGTVLSVSFANIIEDMGIMKALKKIGLSPGDTVMIGNRYELEYQPEDANFRQSQAPSVES
jgi:hypothetical protein